MTMPVTEGGEGQPRAVTEPVDSSLYASVARLHMPDAVAGMAFSSLAPSSHTLLLDTTPEYGGASAGHEPLELLLIALGSCTSMDVISILRKKRQQVTHYSVNVYANLAKEHPKTYTEIMVEHVVGGVDVDPKAVTRALELSIKKYCPVNALLARATQVEHVYRILDSS